MAELNIMFDLPQRLRSKHDFSLLTVLDWTHPAFYGRPNPYQYFFAGIFPCAWHHFQHDESSKSYIIGTDEMWPSRPGISFKTIGPALQILQIDPLLLT